MSRENQKPSGGEEMEMDYEEQHGGMDDIQCMSAEASSRALTDFMVYDNTLSWDSRLKFADANLVDAFKAHLNLKKQSKLEKLRTLGDFPDTHVFAQLASRVYGSHAFLKKDSNLPEGWKLVTTAYNSRFTNGYFGAIFIQPQYNRVVVAHRGTEVKNVGSVLTDLTGIVFNNCVSHIESACTLVEKVTEAMRQIEMEYPSEVSFELIFTGHSLGAFLTQLTAFSNEYLKMGDNEFTRNFDRQRKIFHAITYAFDSPGAMSMLMKWKNRYESEEYPINLDDLHLTSYLSAPNGVNTCNDHYGHVFRTFIDTSNMSYLDRTLHSLYTVRTHSMDAIVKSFERGDDLERVLLWPVRQGLAGFSEFTKFFRTADYRNRYHLSEHVLSKIPSLGIKYRTKISEIPVCPMNTFNILERQFIEFIHWFSNTSGCSEILHEIFQVFSDKTVINNIEQKMSNFKIEQQNITFNDYDTKRKFIPLVKELLKNFPRITNRLSELMKDDDIRGKVFFLESEQLLQGIKSIVEYKPAVLDINEIFQKQFVHVKVKQGNLSAVLFLMYENFDHSNYSSQYKDGNVLILNMNRFLIVNQIVDFDGFLSKEDEKFLIIIYFEDHQNFDVGTKKAVSEFLNNVKGNELINIVAIGSFENEAFESFGVEAKNIYGHNFAEVEKNLSWADIKDDSKQKILQTTLTFQGRTEKLCNLIPPHDIVCDNEVLAELLKSDKIQLNCDPLLSSNFVVYTTVYDKKEVNIDVLMDNLDNSNCLFYISGLFSECFDENCSALKNVFKPPRGKENMISQSLAVNSDNFGFDSKKLYVYTLPYNENCVADFDAKFRILEDPTISIHWLKLKNGKLTLRKSYFASKYYERKVMVGNKEYEIQELMKEPKKKVFILTGSSGDGKSAFLTQMARRLLSNHFIFYLNCTELSFPKNSTEFSLETFKSFLKQTEDVKLFHFVVEMNMKGFVAERPVMIFLDSFEKVRDESTRIEIIKMIKFFNQSTACKIFTTATPSLGDSIAANHRDLNATILKFKRPSQEDQVNILREEWRSYFNMLMGPKKASELLDSSSSSFSKFGVSLIQQLKDRIDAKEKVMGIPAQIHYIAEGFRDDFQSFSEMSRIRRMLYNTFTHGIFNKQYTKRKFDFYVGRRVEPASAAPRSRALSQTVNYHVPEDVRKRMNENYDMCTGDTIWFDMTENQTPGDAFGTFVGSILNDNIFGKTRDFLEITPDALPNIQAFTVTPEIYAYILGKPMIEVVKNNHKNLLSYLIDVLKQTEGLKDVVLAEDEKKKTALEHAIENERAICLSILVKFLIEFGNAQVFKQKLNEIGINRINEFMNDRDVQALSEFMAKL